MSPEKQVGSFEAKTKLDQKLNRIKYNPPNPPTPSSSSTKRHRLLSRGRSPKESSTSDRVSRSLSIKSSPSKFYMRKR